MTKEKIVQLRKLVDEVQNFMNCYDGCELWGDADNCVSPETLISFLIENPHFQQIADNIKKLNTIIN